MRTPFKSLALSAAALLTLSACAGAGTADQQAEAVGTPGAPGSIEYRDTWAPGYRYDDDDGKYYRLRPAN